jgi:hypothetical protein
VNPPHLVWQRLLPHSGFDVGVLPSTRYPFPCGLSACAVGLMATNVAYHITCCNFPHPSMSVGKRQSSA